MQFGLVGFGLVYLVWLICFHWFNTVLFCLVRIGLLSWVWSSLVHFVCSGFFRLCLVWFGLVRGNYCNLSKKGFDPISTQYLLRLRTVLPF